MSFKSWLKTGDIVGADFGYRQLPDELDVYDHDVFHKNTATFYVTCSNLKTGKAEYIQIKDMQTSGSYKPPALFLILLFFFNPNLTNNILINLY